MKTIGKYVVEEVIGRGGMGTVYRAHDPVIGRKVAVKVIAEHVASHPHVKERLYKEAKSAGGLSHENIMTIFDIGEQEGQPYLVMELLDGDDLRTVLDSGRTLSFDEKIDIALQICRALAYAHRARVIHRDIKPENIRVLSSGRVKIVDFGIARFESETRTLTHASIGTPRYMSPEQVRGAEIDQRADIFSFGVLLYELLTGINPFDGSHVTAVIYKILHEEPEPIQLDDARLCEGLQRIISKCLQKDADLRYADFASVIQDLNEVLWNRPERTRPASDPDETRVMDVYRTEVTPPNYEQTRYPAEQTVKRPIPENAGEGSVSSRRGALYAGVGVVFVVALLAGYLLFFRGGDPDVVPDPVVSDIDIITGEEEVAHLRQAALDEQARMLAAKERIEDHEITGQVRTLFDQAVASEQAAVEAMDEGSLSGYERAADRFSLARTFFEAVAGAEGGAGLQQQAEQARRAMEQARQRVLADRSDPEIAGAFSSAERAAGEGAASLGAGNYAAAVQRFGEAERGFREARRTLDARAAEVAARRRADEARQSAEAARERAMPWREASENVARFQSGENLWNEGVRFSQAGRHNDAANRFERAASAYAEVTEPRAPAVGRADAERARTAMAAARESVPQPLRGHERHAEAESIRSRAESAFRDGSFEDAEELFGQAATVYTEVAAMPVPRTAEEAVLESINTLTSRFRSGLENRDINALRNLHTFLGGYGAMFDIAEDIRADVRHSNLRLLDDRATVVVTVDLTYRNRTQRMRQEEQKVNLLWTLERGSGDEWRIRDITRN